MGYLAYVIPIDGQGGHPDQGLPPGYGGRPDQGLPGGGWRPTDPGFGQGGGRPDQGLPGGGHISNRPPGQPLPPHIGGRPPQGGGRPDQGLPQPGATPHGVAAATAPPAQVDPTNGAWVLVALGDGMVVWAWAQPQNVGSGGEGGSPDNTLPGSQPGVDNTLPGSQPHPGNRPPGSASGQPRPDQGLPPAPQPKK